MISWNGRGRSCAGTLSNAIAVPESARFGRTGGFGVNVEVIGAMMGTDAGEGRRWMVDVWRLIGDGLRST